MMGTLPYAMAISGTAPSALAVILGLIVFVGGLALLTQLIRYIAERRAATRPSVHLEPPDASWRSRVHPGQICWASLQFADRPGWKDRPCLVIRTHEQGVDVLKITSKNKSHRYECIQIPTRSWDKRAREDSWLDLGESYFIWDQAIRRVAGFCDAATWHQVTRRHRTGYVYIANSAGDK
ncbi:hypothetical protein ACBR40_39170 [Nonomuraea sp. AD125B]|uniref:hypothetical protein n=1 Tax=Nonomuraea sp. AD125B TaxID=3242897 RepID=UPI003528E437